MEQAKIGAFIQTLRKEKGLTQKELADMLGVTDRAISKWENGRGMPEVSLMKALCDTLDITINELLSGEKIDQNDYREKSESAFLSTMDLSDRKLKRKETLLWVVTIFTMLLVLAVILLVYTLPVTRGFIRPNEEIGISMILKTVPTSGTETLYDYDDLDITEEIDRERLKELLPLMRISLGTEPANTYWAEDVTYQIYGYFKTGPRERETFLIYLGDWNYLLFGSAERGHQIINPETWLAILEWIE